MARQPFLNVSLIYLMCSSISAFTEASLWILHYFDYKNKEPQSQIFNQLVSEGDTCEKVVFSRSI